MPENPKLLDTQEEVQKKLDEMQKVEDSTFMKKYTDVTMDTLISQGSVIHESEIAPGFKVKLRTLKKKEELEIKERMTQYEGSQMYVIDQINTDTLVKALVSINGIALPTEDKKDPKTDEVIESAFESRKRTITDLPDALCMAMLEEYRALNKALVILIKGSSKNSLARLLLGRESA
jgi:hypothetical protein